MYSKTKNGTSHGLGSCFWTFLVDYRNERKKLIIRN